MVIAEWPRGSGNRYRPPRTQPGLLRRERVETLVDASVRAHRVTVVSAPSGFGKTSAIAAWASATPGRVAWLTAGEADADPAVLAFGALQALRSLARSGATGRGLGTIDPNVVEVGSALDMLDETLGGLDEPVCLVVDDAHRVGASLTTGLVGALIDSGPENLRLIVVGTGTVDTTLARWVLSHPASLIRSDRLALDRDEIAALADGTDLPIDSVWKTTRGWPIAVRFMQLTGVDPDTVRGDQLLRDYVQDHVLGHLPPHLRHFVLDTAVCDELTVDLATAVTGRHDAAALLRRCVRMGLFIDRYDVADGVVYRWHDLFARSCGEILDEAEPGRRGRVHSAAAAYLERHDPLRAVGHWLAASAPEAAVRVIMGRWIGIIVGGDATGLDRACASLPPPYDKDAGILLVRACAHDALGAVEIAQTLLAQATARARESPGNLAFNVSLPRARLLLLDDRAAVAEEAERVHAQLATTQAPDTRDRAALLFLLGWTGMRHRHDPERTVELLMTAVREAAANGDESLRNRAQRTLAFVLAWSGRLQQARQVLEAVRELDGDDSPWVSYASGSTATVTGMVAYWSDDLATAEREFDRAIRGGSTATSFGGVARMMLALTAAAGGDPVLCRRAGVEIDRLPRREMHGISWPAFRESAQAALAEATGQIGRALQIVDKYRNVTDLPLITVVLAGIVRRQGDPERALDMLRRLRQYERLSYVKVAALTTAALVHQLRGRQDLAHELFEQALSAAEVDRLHRLFADTDPALQSLLRAHLARGTHHEALVAACLRSEERGGPLTLLSPRERDVLDQLRTSMTITEIAEALQVSVNTVKTHKRAIYRKLDVTSRREAVGLLR